MQKKCRKRYFCIFACLRPGLFLNRATTTPSSILSVWGCVRPAIRPNPPSTGLSATSVFIHVCTHAGITMLTQLSWTCEYKTGQASRLKQWYRLCIAKRSHYNWNVFQSLNFSGKSGIKADRIRWILFVKCMGQCSTLSFAYLSFRKALNTVFPLPRAAP